MAGSEGKAFGSSSPIALIVSGFIRMSPTNSASTGTSSTTNRAAASDAGRRTQAATAADLYEPVSAENVLYDSRDEGLVTLDDGTTAHRVFQSYLDTYTWRNPHTNASLRWTVPRDEVRVIPVRAY